LEISADFDRLNRKSKEEMIDHTQLSKFRSSLTFVQQINLLLYILHHFSQSGLLGDNILHGINSTELASDCKLPLVTLNIKGKIQGNFNTEFC
jgi:hypothetical protein